MQADQERRDGYVEQADADDVVEEVAGGSVHEFAICGFQSIYRIYVEKC